MPANFSLRKLFKSLRSKRVGNLEVQNDVHPPDGPSTPPVASEIPTCEAETLMAPELCITASLDEDNTKVASNSVTKPRDPPKPPVIINGQGNRAIPNAGAKNPLLPASAVQETLKASSSHVAHAQIPPSLVPVTNAQAGPAADDSRAKEPLPVTEFAVKETQAISTSQRLWNAAYDSLEKNDDTAKLVRSYMKILTKVLKDEKAPDPSALDDISADLKDPIRRQTYLQDLVKKGQKNIATTSKIAEGVDNVIEYIDKAKDMISVAIGNIPQAALPWAGVYLGLQILSNPGKATRSNLSGIAHIVSRMDWYCALTEHLLDNNNIIIGEKSFKEVLGKLEETIITLYEALLQYQIKSVCYYRSRSLAVLRGLANWDDWDSDLKRVTDAETTVESMSVQYHREYEKSSLRQLVDSDKKMETLLDGIHKDLRDFMAQQKIARIDDQDMECLQALFVMDPQDDMDLIQQKKEEKLFDATYKWILDTNKYAKFTDWSMDDPSKQPSRLLWIKGPAGTGKTMLLIGIIRQLSDQYAVLSPNVSHFFCQDTTDEAHKNATDILKSLLWMLLFQQPQLISHLRTEYRQKGRSLFSDEKAFIAMSRAFICMLNDPRLSATYFIVDALDECNQGLTDLLKLISTSLKLTDKVKWLVSSRPDIIDLARLQDLDTVGNLIELDAQTLEDPVNMYIDYKLSALKEKVGYDENTLARVSNLVRQQANKTFLWVALVFKDLDSVEGWDAVGIVEQIPSDLSKLYDRMMARIEYGNEQNRQRCKNVLVATFLAYRLLSVPELAVLAGLSLEMTQTIIGKCGSFLIIEGETVSLIHKSAKDYLDAIYISRLQKGGVAQGHAEISRRSIAAISNLENNIYALHPGSKLEDITALSPDPLEGLQYCCVYWIHHFQKSDAKLYDYDQVYLFLQKHLLHWLEALGWMGKTSEGILAILLLEAQISTEKSSDLYAFVYDAKRFALHNRSVIEQAPLQLYCSALIFAPENSVVRRYFANNIPDWIQTRPQVQANWNAALQTFERHSSWVGSVVFSPDSRLVASGSSDKTVRIWDTDTGALLHVLTHSFWVNSVVFSPDGKLVVSGSSDKTVRIWDANTGDLLHTLIHSRGVTSLAISSDGKLVVSGLLDGSIRLWDVVTRTVVWDITTRETPLEGHQRDVLSVAFSRDGNLIASGSADTIIRLWDPATGALLQTLQGHSSRVLAVAFSNDNKLIASGSDDKTIRLWDATTRVVLHTLKGHLDEVHSVVFSRDNEFIISGSKDNTIRLWDTFTRALLHTFTADSTDIWSVALSPNGKFIASGEGDGIIRIWDATLRASPEILESHSSWIRSIAFSPNGKLVVSGANNGIIRVWDWSTTEVHILQEFKAHPLWVSALAFSLDGKLIVSGSYNDIIRLWDIRGVKLQSFQRYSKEVSSLAFSPTGNFVVSGLDNGAVRLYDIATGGTLRIFKDYTNKICLTVFSPDGKLVISGSDNGTVRSYDVATGLTRRTFNGHMNKIRSLVFSPNGELIISDSDDMTVRLWDIATGELLETLQGYSSWASSISFSADGKVVPGLRVSTYWIGEGREPILWLPHDYRTTHIAIWNGIIALGLATGKIFILDFKAGFKHIQKQ